MLREWMPLSLGRDRAGNERDWRAAGIGPSSRAEERRRQAAAVHTQPLEVCFCAAVLYERRMMIKTITPSRESNRPIQ
jgi:hypothetical protein